MSPSRNEVKYHKGNCYVLLRYNIDNLYHKIKLVDPVFFSCNIYSGMAALLRTDTVLCIHICPLCLSLSGSLMSGTVGGCFAD